VNPLGGRQSPRSAPCSLPGSFFPIRSTTGLLPKRRGSRQRRRHARRGNPTVAADPPAGCASRCAPPPWNTARTSGLLTPGNGPCRPSWTNGQRSVPCARSFGTRRSGHRTLPPKGACPGTFLSLPECGCNPPPERSGYHRARGSDAGPVDGASPATIPLKGTPGDPTLPPGCAPRTTGVVAAHHPTLG